SFTEDPVRDRVLRDITEYATIDRHTWIPFAGVHHSILDQWWSKHSEFDPRTGKWVFTASVKNYDSVIEKFLTLVLWHLIEGEHLIQVEVEPYGHQRSIDTL